MHSSETVYEAGTIDSVKGNDVSVKTADGQVRKEPGAVLLISRWLN